MPRRRVLFDRYPYVVVAADGTRTYNVADKGDVIDVDDVEAARGDAMGALAVDAGAATGPRAAYTGERPADYGLPRGELDRAELKVNAQVPSNANSNVNLAVAALTLDIAVAERPILLGVNGTVQSGQATTQHYVSVFEKPAGGGADVLVAEWHFTLVNAFAFVGVGRHRRIEPAPGPHTYVIKHRAGAINQLVALIGTNDDPFAFYAQEV